MSNDQNSEKLRLQIYISECAKIDDSKLKRNLAFFKKKFEFSKKQKFF